MTRVSGFKGIVTRRIKRLLEGEAPALPEPIKEVVVTNTSYWTDYNVTSHCDFQTREQSLDYLRWRNGVYLFYDELMPCSGFDDAVILDYGCGPGHDLVGFVELSKPRKVLGMDISSTSLAEARRRLAQHDARCVDFVQIRDGQPRLPLEDNTVDYIHSSGVLHHTPNMGEILGEFYRVLKPSGLVRVMVYNYQCIWLHLYVAYIRRIVQRLDQGLSLAQSFQRSTDTERCPISRWYKKEDFLREASDAGWKGRFLGAAISLNEMELLPQRFTAIADRALPGEHREFLRRLEFDRFGQPLWQGHIAGLDGVYELRKS